MKQSKTSESLQQGLLAVTQKGLFPCKFVGIHLVHNYLMAMREGRLDKTSLLILDLRPA